MPGLNWRPRNYEFRALPTELIRQPFANLPVPLSPVKQDAKTR